MASRKFRNIRLMACRLESREVPATALFRFGVDGFTGVTQLSVTQGQSTWVDGSSKQNYFLDGNPNQVGGETETQDLIRFDGIFGTGPGQIPPGSIINNAKLYYTTSAVANAQTGGPYTIHQMLSPFSNTPQFANIIDPATPAVSLTAARFTPGVTSRPSGAFWSDGFGHSQNEVTYAEVTEFVQDWSLGGANHGFNVRARTTDGWSIHTIGNTTANFRPLLEIDYTPADSMPSVSRFQQGVGGYTGSGSVFLPQSNLTIDGGTLGQQFLDGPDGAGSPDDQMLVRFNDIFGGNSTQVPANAEILKAWLVITTGNTSSAAKSSGPYTAAQMLVDWDATSTYSGFGPNGPSVGDGSIAPPMGTAIAMIDDSRALFDITPAVTSWRDGKANFGLNVRSAGTADGWQVHFTGSTTIDARPELIVLWAPGKVDPVPPGTLDVTGGKLDYNAPTGDNNATLKLAAGVYTITDNQPITLSQAAKDAGWNGSGSNTVSGPEASVDSLRLRLGAGTDTFTLLTPVVPVDLEVQGGYQAGDTLNLPVGLDAKAAARFLGFDLFNPAAGKTLAAGSLTLEVAAVGTDAEPLKTQVGTLVVSTSKGGIFLTEQDGADVTFSSAGETRIGSVGGLLAVAGGSLSGKALTLTSGDGIVLNAPILAETTTLIRANTDGAGDQGLIQTAAGEILTPDKSSEAVRFEVNTAAGGTGAFVQGAKVTTFNGATVSVQAHGGPILSTGGIYNVGSAGTVSFESQVGIGSSTNRVRALAGTFIANSGEAGVFLDDAGGGNTNMFVTVKGGEIDLLSSDAGGNNMTVAAPLFTPNGNIIVRADDDLFINADVGGPDFKGTILLAANLDGGNSQVINIADGVVVQTQNKSDTAIRLLAYPQTNSTGIGGIIAGNIIAGDGATILLDAAAPLTSPTDVARNGAIVARPGTLIDAGPTGTVILKARQNQIGWAGEPITVKAANVVAITSSTTSTTNGGQKAAEIHVLAAGPAAFSGSTTTAGTRVGTINFTTLAGPLTIHGDTFTDSGAITLTADNGIVLNGNLGKVNTTGPIALNAGTGKITQTGGVITTTGSLTYSADATFSTGGNNVATIEQKAGRTNVTGDFAFGNTFNVGNGATLGGDGFTANVNLTGATLAPGLSPGTLKTGNLNFDAASALQFEINGTSPGSYDRVNVTGTVNLGGAALKVIAGAFTPTPGAVVTVIDNDGTDGVIGTFDGLAEGAAVTIAGKDFVLSYKGGDGNDVTLTAPGTPVVPAKITAVKVNGGGDQRSMVTSLVVAFDQIVTFTGTAAEAFVLERTGPGGATGAVTLAAATDTGSGATVVTLSFSGGLTTAGSLNDGNYKLTVSGTKVIDFDGNNDGQVGGDFVDATIFRLFGDADGNRSVNFNDFLAFRTTFGLKAGDAGFNSAFDFDANDSVDFSDFLQFRTRFGTTLTTP